MSEEQLQRAIAAMMADNFAEAYRLLQPLADAGNIYAQAQCGSIVWMGLHRFADLDAINESNPEKDAAYNQGARQEDLKLAKAWLEAASGGGDGNASHNLAMMYVEEACGVGWGDRRPIILALLAKARSQGFCHINDGDPPGLAYVQFLESCDEFPKGVQFDEEQAPAGEDGAAL